MIGAALAMALGGFAWPADAEVDYLRDIKPVLKERCYACHGALKQNAGLRMDTAELLRKGGKDGPVLVPGDPASASLLARLTTSVVDDRMPQEASPLKPGQIAAIRDWIAAGAPIPADERGEDDPREHWAFQRIERPAVPGSPSTVNPIDAFLEQKLRKHSLQPQPEAERSILLRRLYLDLVGLPPTLEQLRDSRPYETIVDELLLTPQHGERWARHWMDVWRYSDWYGLGAQLRNSQKHLWHWRDWIVDSLNADKGYDRMVQEMLAGDELAPNDPDAIRATGFLARNYYLFNRTTWLDDTIEHTGKAFLGLTLNCAKCHDHKYDPITHVDYYNFRAIFEPHQVRLDPLPGEADFEKDGLPRVFDNYPDEPTYLHVRGDPADPDKETQIKPAVPALLASFATPIKPVKLPTEVWAPSSRAYVKRDRLAVAKSKIEAATNELAAARQRLAAVPKLIADPVAVTAAAPAEPWLMDDFDKKNPAAWELIGEGWKYQGGQLIQSQTAREIAMLRTRKPLPTDFDLTCRYTTTGGTTYKSVTFRFDLSKDGKDCNFVYTSAHEAGPKVQVAHTAGGHDAYPADGRINRPILVGKAYELRFAVRDRLLNVWLDGEFLLAYTLPTRNPGGFLALSGFDATVAFDLIEVRELSPDLKLTAAKAGASNAPISAEDAAAGVTLAESKLAAAEADFSHLQAVIAADAAALSGKDEDALAKAASQAEGEALKARASLNLLTLKPDDKTKRKAADKALAEAEKMLAAKDKIYTPLYGAKKALETPEHNDLTYPSTYPPTSTGRRLMLARWMTSRENPLTARVAVNQVWMRHFGEPLVETVVDFGRQARRPEHLELLDYLAAEFIESGWSFRHLHRLIVTSDGYRRSSSNAGSDPATLAADPSNRFYWRAHPRRMESQVIRDSLLQLAGTLDPQAGGPPVDPNGSSLRRSMYFKQSRDHQDRFLSMFDDADILQCYRRSESIVPQQALALANSALSIENAGKIAERLFVSRPSSDRGEFIDAAFEQLLGRMPDDLEREECDHYWDEMAALDSIQKNPDSATVIRSRLVHALLNHNDFIFIR